MIILERREKILAILEKKRTATFRELADQLFISEASVRRDVEALEKAGQVRRIYGGVVLEKFHNAVVPLGFREGENSQIKEDLARRAADMVQDGDSIMLDASSTVRRMIKYLSGKRGLKIITNNPEELKKLCRSSYRQILADAIAEGILDTLGLGSDESAED